MNRGDTIARIDTERLALTLRDNEAVVKRLEAQLQLLATQRNRLQTLGQASCRRASSTKRFHASTWPSRTWSRRAWRAIARASI